LDHLAFKSRAFFNKLPSHGFGPFFVASVTHLPHISPAHDVADRLWNTFLSAREDLASIRECDGHHEMSDSGADSERVHSLAPRAVSQCGRTSLDGPFTSFDGDYE
jgi:hypothetical protein